MKKTFVLMALSVVGALGLLTSAAHAQKSYTAQSQMVELNLPGGGNDNTYLIQGTIRWSFNSETAGAPADVLGNTSATFTSSTCSGGGSNTGQPCNSANAPATPTPTAAQIIAALTSGGGASWSNTEKATFYCGGTITRTGTLQLTRTGLNGSGTWKFNYNISASTGLIAPETAWDSEENTNGVKINCDGFVAGESVVFSSKRVKYSFSMATIDPLTLLPVSRTTGVTAYLEVQDPTYLTWSTVASQPVDTTEVTDQIDTGLFDEITGEPIFEPYDFLYYGNAGQSGKTEAIGYLHAPGRLAAEFAGLIMDNDGFAGNDGTYPERAIMQPFSFDISSDPGVYRVRVTGTIKGNVGTVDSSFNVSESFNVIGDPNCGG